VIVVIIGPCWSFAPQYHAYAALLSYISSEPCWAETPSAADDALRGSRNCPGLLAFLGVTLRARIANSILERIFAQRTCTHPECPLGAPLPDGRPPGGPFAGHCYRMGAPQGASLRALLERGGGGDFFKVRGSYNPNAPRAYTILCPHIAMSGPRFGAGGCDGVPPAPYPDPTGDIGAAACLKPHVLPPGSSGLPLG
jgi:hypothetical protein